MFAQCTCKSGNHNNGQYLIEIPSHRKYVSSNFESVHVSSLEFTSTTYTDYCVVCEPQGPVR